MVGINVGLLLLAVAGLTVVTTGLLQQLADDQALARVAQAGASAQSAIAQAGDEVLTDAQLLAERPTLRRLLDARDAESLTTFLSQFQQTSHLGGAAVVMDGQVFAQSGAPLLWERLSANHPEVLGAFFEPQDFGEPLVLGARAEVPGLPDASVLTVALLDGSFAEGLSADIGLGVTVRDRRSALGEGPLIDLASQVATTGDSTAASRADLGAYVAIVPLRSGSDEIVGFVEARLPTTDVTNSLRRLLETLLVMTVAVATLAALISSLSGRWLVRPLLRLRNAAARIGHGDLETPIGAISGGEIGTLAVTLEDMRRRLLRLTADLKRQQAESNAIVTSIIEGVFTVDRERRLRYLNPQAAALLGVDAKEAIGQFCGDVLNPQGTDQIRPCEEHCPIVHSRFRAGARATEHLMLRNGARRTVVITSAPPSDNQQVQVIRDETEVEATRRLRDAVLANISHEFRTPLSAQLASIELLLDQLPELSTEQIGTLTLSLQRGTLRLTQLIDNLLESVRIEAGEHAIRRRLVQLDEVIEQALEFTQPLLAQREQGVEVELPYPMPAISGDATRLTQVFVNLLANANKFAPAGSTIRIGGAVEPAAICVWVEDQGPGIPPQAGQSLFTRFMRSTGEEPEQGGVGLGLWIVKSIVERHGGRVEAVSDSTGTRMRVTLPRGNES